MMLTVGADLVPLRAEEDGTLRVGETRVTLDIVIAAFQQGMRPEELGQEVDVLELADIYAVVAFYLRHQAEVDDYLAERKERAAELRAKMEAQWGDQSGLRERLLARLAQRHA